MPETGEPNQLLLWGIGLAFFALLIFLLWLNHKIATRGQPKSEAAETPRARSRPLDSPAPTPRASIVDMLMSRMFGAAGPLEAGASALDSDPAEDLQPLATPCKAANDSLARQELDARSANDLSDITPAEARAIIRQQARAEAIVAILKAAEAGKVKSAGDQAGLIEAVAGGSRTSRPGTPYMALKLIVDELRSKPKVVFYDELRQKIEAEAR